MSVVPLTLTISLCLVFTFLIFFLREHARGAASGAERDSLLPLAEEEPRPARVSAPLNNVSAGCDCQGGRRTPCAGCRGHK